MCIFFRRKFFYLNEEFIPREGRQLELKAGGGMYPVQVLPQVNVMPINKMDMVVGTSRNTDLVLLTCAGHNSWTTRKCVLLEC